MKITVIGGGNIGTLMAAEASYKGHEVTVYTSKPEHWKKEIRVYSADDRLVLTGNLSRVTSSIQEALESSDHIWVTVPAFMFSDLAKKMLPFVCKGQKIGIVPGRGGAEFAFNDLIAKGCILFGFQRVHNIARIKEYGKSVYELGKKSEIRIGAIPTSKVDDICTTISKLFDMHCVALDNYLSVTLTPSNSILHTSRLYSMFKGHKDGDIYLKNFLFYEEWTDDSSEMLIACDAELQNLCNVIPMELGSVMSLKNYYESQTVEAMTKKISSIKAFKGLTSPMQKVKSGWIPDWQSRYFIEDFPFGIKIIMDIAEMFKVSTPNSNIMWHWYKNIAMVEGANIFNTTITAKDFIDIYKQ